MAKNTEDGSFWQSIFDGISNAIADVRNKVVDESWFGRRTTDHEISNNAARYRSIASDPGGLFDEQWRPIPPSEHEQRALSREFSSSSAIEH